MLDGIALTLYSIVSGLLTVVSWTIIAAIISQLLVSFNVINLYNNTVRQIYTSLQKINDFFCAPVRKILPDFGGLDFSPAVVLIVIGAIQRAFLPSLLKAVL